MPLDASGQRRATRADLELTAVQEPPDFAQAGQRFTFEVTTTNEGNRTAGASVTRLTLSAGRTPDSGDIRVGGAINVPRLAPGRSSTGRTNVVIPNNLPARSFFLIACADVGNRVPESDNLHNCRLSGQKMDIGPPPNAPDGPPGAAGPNGRVGNGFNETRRIARTELALGRANVDDTVFPDAVGDSGFPDEGSTQATDLVKIGPVTLRATCKRVTNGDDGDPDDPPVAGQENNFDQDGDEAKILVQTDSGNVSFHGPHGPRWNVPSGTGDEPGNNSPQHGGDGAHMALVAMHDPDPDSTEGNSGTFNGQTREDYEWRAGWQSGSVYVAQSGGTEFVAHLWAGIDVLGIGPERCVFGGSVYVVKG